MLLMMMPTEFQKHCDVVEECYEFSLSYAAQGHATDKASPQGRQLRESLARSVDAMRGMEASCAALLEDGALEPAATYKAFFAVLARDVQDAIAAMELVLVQPAISSQLIDNLNASIHLRALLTDIFLVEEILEAQQSRATAEQHELG